MWSQTTNRANKRLVLHVWLRCGSLSITTVWTLVSLLVNEFDVQSILHGQARLATLYLSWGYERLQKPKDSLKACFENVNILEWTDTLPELNTHTPSPHQWAQYKQLLTSHTNDIHLVRLSAVINPFIPKGISHCYQLNQSIFILRVVGR